MKGPGRPSHREDDLKAIVAMAEIWLAGKGEHTVRALSQIMVGIRPRGIKPEAWSGMNADMVAGKGTPESKAKRLERQFHELDQQGLMVPVSVYRVRDIERHGALRRLGKEAFGPFHKHRLTDPVFVEADRAAVNAAARLCKRTLEEVEELSVRGLQILREWLPHDYPSSRI